MKVWIYTMEHPITGEVRYVGKTSWPKQRMYGHLFMQHHGNNGKTHSSRWIQQLQRQGLEPVMDIIEEIDCEDNETWIAAEQFYIQYFRFLGVRLTNITIGGEGFSGCRHTPEMKEHFRQLALKRAPNPEAAKKIGLANRGKKRTPEQIERAAATHRGKKRSPEACENIRKSLLGKMPPALAFENAIKATKGKKLSPEHVAKVRAALTGKKRTPEQCARIKAALAKAFENGLDRRRGVKAMHEANRGRKQSPEQIAKRLATKRRIADEKSKEEQFWDAAM